MTEIYTATIGRIEEVFNSLGMMTGGGAIFKRIIIGGIIGGILVTWIKPDIMFTEGVARPWAMLEPGNADATQTPWYTAVVAGGFVTGFLV